MTRRILSIGSLLGMLFFNSSFLDATLDTKDTMPEFLQKRYWINTSPMKVKNYSGKVVLVYFWNSSSYASLNNIRFLNYIYDLYDSFGFEMLGIHSPKFEFEKDPDEIVNSLLKYKILFPVATDENKDLSIAYRVREIPTLILIDSLGQVRQTFSGHYDYPAIHRAIVSLLEELDGFKDLNVDENIKKLILFEHQPNLLTTGYEDLAFFGNFEKPRPEIIQPFKFPEYLHPDNFYLQGDWQFSKDRLTTRSEGALLRIRTSHRVLNLIAGIRFGGTAQALIRMDGAPIPADDNAGVDIDLSVKELPKIKMSGPRLYNLTDLSENREHLIELEFDKPEIDIYGLSLSDIPVQFKETEDEKKEREAREEAETPAVRITSQFG